MLVLPRFELVLMIFLDEAAAVGTRALLAPGSGQRTCCPSLSEKVSQHIHTKSQLLWVAHLEFGRVHLEPTGGQAKSFRLDHGKCLTRSCCQRAPP